MILLSGIYKAFEEITKYINVEGSEYRLIEYLNTGLHGKII